MFNKSLSLEEDNIVGDDTGTDAGFAFLVGDLAVCDFACHESSLAFL